MAKKVAAAGGDEGYDAHKEAARLRQAEQSAAGRDIGKLPNVKDPDRKARCERDLKLFCEEYYPEVFSLGWSPDHLAVIAKLEAAVLTGGLFAMAMPRGSGKTTLCEVTAEWAIAYGHRLYVALIGSSETHAKELLSSIKTQFESNPLLLEDFPEVCYPIRQLEGIANRCAGQTYQGERTQITWTETEVVLPTIAGAKSSSAIITVAGITGRVRGMKFLRPDGKPVRPDLVIIDDPQTDESAASTEPGGQCDKRERIVGGAVVGLAGPGKKIAGAMPCTVIRPNDMAHRILDRSKHAVWQGQTYKLIYRWPQGERAEKLWQEYAELRRTGQQEDRGTGEADEFYRKHRKAMDAGAIVAWEERKFPEEISALQHAWNLRIDFKDPVFFSEYQNDPILEEGDTAELTAEWIVSKLNRLKRGTVPAAATSITSFVDVQQTCLYWMVCAWAQGFDGWILDYGTTPRQIASRFALKEVQQTLELEYKGRGLEGRIYAGLQDTANLILAPELKREGGGVARVTRGLIDANWGKSTKVVYQFCRESAFSSILVPSHGRGILSDSVPMANWAHKEGDRHGLNWVHGRGSNRRATPHVVYDTNFWKSFVAERLLLAMGARGSVSLFGEKASAHEMLAEQFTSEKSTPTTGRGRRVDVWKLRPTRPDNHLWDCFVGCAVAASMDGIELKESAEAPRKPRRRITQKDVDDKQQRRAA